MVIRKSAIDVLVVLLLVLASGNPAAAYLVGKEAILIGLPLVFLSYGFVRRRTWHPGDILVWAMYASLTAYHFIAFGVSAAPALLGFLLRLAAAWLAARTVRDFMETYVRVLHWLAGGSLVFFGLQLATAGNLREWLAPLAIPYSPGVVHLGFHNFGASDHALRNCGVFWEPGAFAGYLLLAAIFDVMKQMKAGGGFRVDKRLLVILAALATTQSTAGYIALLVFGYAMALAFGNRYFIRAILASILIFPIAVIGFAKIPFLGEKVRGQMESAILAADNSEINRFGNAFYDFEFVKQRPMAGWSVSTETRLIVDRNVSDVTAGQGNGLTGLVVRFGLIGFGAFVAALFLVFRSFGGGTFAVLASTSVLLVLVGEQYLNYPLFWSLLFLTPPSTGRVKGRGQVGSRGRLCTALHEEKGVMCT